MFKEQQRINVMNEMAGIVLSKVAAKKAKDKFNGLLKKKKVKEDLEGEIELTDLGSKKSLLEQIENESDTSSSDEGDVDDDQMHNVQF